MTSNTPAQSGSESNLSPLKRAFLALEAAESRAAAYEDAARGPIAIIGLGCHVPGADGPDAFWSLLDSGVDATTEVPSDRWDHGKYYASDPNLPGRIATNRGGFLDRIDQFDANLFGIAPREARSMDPQQRIFLETAWEALEHAGVAPDSLSGTKTGVFCGVTGSDYAYLQLATHDPEILDAHFTSGIAHSMVSGRLSYLLGLQGPSVTIDTACSSSLVAIHQAVQSLRKGEIRMALAGGVNTILSPEIFIALSRAHMLAPDGRCKTFDASADGFARGEGCGVIVLKRLKDAEADGDRVLALIRGSAVNQDGPSSGLTAPNGPAQEAVIKAALIDAGIQANDLSYLEAHGTGTSLGDPQEMQAIGNVFSTHRSTPLIVGSVKTNIGHLEAAAGVTGVIKTVLMLIYKRIPPHLHFNTPSLHIPWSNLPVRIPTKAEDWEPINEHRFASVSSFGFSGTNAHIVLGEFEHSVANEISDSSSVVTISAASPNSLRALAQRHAEALSGSHTSSLNDLCRTANAGRAQLSYRATVSGETSADLHAGFAAVVEVKSAITGPIRTTPKIAFLFTGQGAQFIGMGRELYERAPVFRNSMDRAASQLKNQLDVPLLDVIFGKTADTLLLDQTRYTQPALFAIETAIFRLWESWGVSPDLVIGHSIGEYAAACAAGIMSFEDGLNLVTERGRLMNSLPAGGGMISINASEDTVTQYLQPGADIAAINASSQVVISGADAILARISKNLDRDGLKYRQLPVSHAFHSSLVDPVLDAFEKRAGQVSYTPPKMRLISNITGATADSASICTPTYWRQHMRETVRFADGVTSMAQQDVDIFVEIGPQPVLTALAKESYEDGNLNHSAIFLPSIRRGQSEWKQMQSTIGSLWQQGLEVDWQAVEKVRGGKVTDIPTYPFEKERHWIAPRPHVAVSIEERGSLFGRSLPVALDDQIWEGTASQQSPGWLNDHIVGNDVIIPGAALISMMAASEMAQPDYTGSIALEDIIIESPVVVSSTGGLTRLQTVRRAHDGFISVSSQVDAASKTWVRHASASKGMIERAPDPIKPESRQVTSGSQIDPDDFYGGLSDRGISLGPTFRLLDRISTSNDGAWARLTLPDNIPLEPSLPLHPLLLDGCLQVVAAARAVRASDKGAFLPFAIGRFSIHSIPSRQLWSHVVVRAEQADMLTVDITAYNADGTAAIELSGVSLRRLDPINSLTAAGKPLRDALFGLEWIAQPPLPSPKELATEAETHADELAAAAGLDSYDTFVEHLEDACIKLVRNTFTELGWHPLAGEQAIENDLAQQINIAPRHRRLFHRLMEILSEAGDLAPIANGWRVLREIHPTNILELEASLRNSAPPAALPELDIVLRAHAGFARALRGECDPLELLFPEGSTEANEALYRDVPTSVYFNGLIAQIVEDVSRVNRPLRILEIGGGTGGTTARLIKVLPDDLDYTFSDIGQSFVDRARTRFGYKAGMSFKMIDLDRDLVEQGVASESIDLVIGANVVHATKNLAETLQRLKQIMSPDGRLVMLEVTKPQRWFDLTVGLTPGWWSYEDTQVRTNSVLLDKTAWLRLLQDVGLSNSATIGGDPEVPGCRGNQTILVAAAARAAAKRWLIVSDPQPLTDNISSVLEKAGETVSRFMRDNEPDWAAALQSYLAASTKSDEAPDEILVLCNMDGVDLASRLASILTVVKSAIKGARPCKLTFMTTGGEEVTGMESTLCHADAAIGGLVRSIQLEFPDFACRRIDLDPDSEDIESIVTILLRHDDETDIAVRDGKRYSTRLRHWQPSPLSLTRVEPWKLINTAPGTLERFERQPLKRSEPGSGEVEVAVEVTGLNFRDVLNALGEYPGAPPLGGECAGRVVAIGDGVENVQLGDAVVALTSGAFASHVTLPASLTSRLPEGFDMRDGAAFAIPFVTADYCLRELGNIDKGERILIHSAAGGVGMAAIQIAHAAGAEIYATAGTAEKRDLVRRLGAKLVMDSRSTLFADQILEATGGLGVDLVLNSLTSELTNASLRALASRGRFIELGVRDIREDLPTDVYEKEIVYLPVNWGHVADADPERIGRSLRRIVSDLDAGIVTPLPQHNFGPDQITDAFRLMAQAGHIGKIVVDWRNSPRTSLRQSGTYIVTGGLSGLGLDTVRRLARDGAGRIVATARRAPTADVEKEFSALRRQGVRIESHCVDVTDEESMDRLFCDIRNDGPPIRGIIHSAGTLSDAGILQQNRETLLKVISPKVDGILILEKLTRSDPIDIFCAYSSLAAILGSPTQSNHSAANAALGLIMKRRTKMGLPGLAIDWGPWDEIGAAAGNNTLSRLSEQGISALSPAEGRAAASYLTSSASGQVAVAPIEWRRLLKWRGEKTNPLFSKLEHDNPLARKQGKTAGSVRKADSEARAYEHDTDLLDRISAAHAAKKRIILDVFLEEMLRATFALPAGRKLDPEMPFGEMGLDSLLAIELRNRLGRALGKKLPATLLFESPTIRSLGDTLMSEFIESPEVTQPTIASKHEVRDALFGLEDLSEEELDKMLGLDNEGAA